MNDDHRGRFTRMPILYDDRSGRYDDDDADSGLFSCGVGVASQVRGHSFTDLVGHKLSQIEHVRLILDTDS